MKQSLNAKCFVNLPTFKTTTIVLRLKKFINNISKRSIVVMKIHLILDTSDKLSVEEVVDDFATFFMAGK